MKRKLLLLIPVIFLYVLIFPEAAAAGARTGLLLWYQSVIPVLFPFMLISSMFLQFGLLEHIPAVVTAPICHLFGCSPNGAFAVVSGFLCGFPMGAKITSDLEKSRKITAQEARFLYGFVNNLSPGFLISYLAIGQMNQKKAAPIFLINILGASILYGVLRSFRFRKIISEQISARTVTDDSEYSPCAESNPFALLDRCIYDSMQNTLRLGGYIIFFSVLSQGLLLLPTAGELPLLFLISNMEVTSGIALLCNAGIPFPLRFLLVHALAAFGGLCAAAQTAGICGMKSHAFLEYIKSRVIITLLSVLLSIGSLFFCRFLF